MKKVTFFEREMRTGRRFGFLIGNWFKRLSAFTLSEVLIALVVVGIVSALTIPTLVSRQNEKAFKKMQNKVRLNVVNTLDMFMTDEGKSNLNAVGMNTADGVRTYLNTYYRVNTVCGDNPTATKCLSDGYKTNSGDSASLPDNLECIKANDGATICMGPINPTTGTGEVFVDTNANKGPNILGQDIITLTYDSKGMLGGSDALAEGALELTILAGTGVNPISPSKVALASGASYHVTPTFETGYILDKLSKTQGDCTISNSTVIMGDKDCTVKVLAKKEKYHLTVINGANCLYSSASDSSVYYGESVNINAQPNDYGTFINWSVSGSCSVDDVSDKSTSVTVEGNCTVTSNCEAPAAVTINAVAGSGISSVSPSSSVVQVGQTQSFVITPDNGYSFNKFTSDNTSVCQVADSNVKVISDNASSCTVTAHGAKESYALTVNKGTCESASGSSSSVAYGAKVSISATPASGGSLSGWSTSGDCSVSDNMVTMGAGACTVTASCIAPPSKYSLSVNPGTCASAAGSGSYTAGKSVSISATPKDGYSFTGFTKTNGTCILNGTTVTMGAGNCSVTAACSELPKNKYNVAVVNNGCSAVSGGGTVEEGASVTVSATPEEGGSFTNWSGCGQTSAASSVTFTPTASCTITANCKAAEKEYTLTVNKDAGFTSTVPASSVKLKKGQTQNLSYTLNEGYDFSGWTVVSGTCTVTNSTVTMGESDCTIKAVSTAKSGTLTVNPGTCASATSGGTLSYGASKSITATPKSGSSFSSWTKSGDCTLSTTSNATTTVKMGLSACTLTANCTTPKHTLTVQKGENIKSVSPSSASIEEGATQTVSATANDGYSYSGLTKTSGDCTISGYNVTMGTTNCTVTANAKAGGATLVVNKGTCESANGGGSVTVGVASNINAFPETYGSFTGWTKSGSCTIANANNAQTTATVTGSGTCTVTASCSEAPTYTLTTAVNPNSSAGTVSAGKTALKQDEQTTVQATASEGYSFSGWSAKGCTLSNQSGNNATVTMGASNCTVTAQFSVNKYTLTATAGTGGSATPASQTISYGESGTVSATPATGYEFSKWTVTSGSCTLGNSAMSSTTVTMGADNCTVTAQFTKKSYTLTTTAGSGGYATPTSATVVYGDTKTITATANSGYRFTGWNVVSPTGASACVISDPTNPVTTVTMGAANCVVNASFDYYVTTVCINELEGYATSSYNGCITLKGNEKVTATATPEPGVVVTGWKLNSAATYGNCDNIYTVNGNVLTATGSTTENVISCYFVPTWKWANYTLNVVAGPGGTVTANGAGSEYKTSDSVEIQHKSGTTVYAQPDEGYSFSSWSFSGTGCDISNTSTSEPTAYIGLNAGDCTATANFVEDEAPLNTGTVIIQTSTGATVTNMGSHTVEEGKVVSSTATVESGYAFSGWGVATGSCEYSVNGTTITVTAKSSNTCVYYPKVEANKVTIRVTSSTGGTGYFGGGGTAIQGTVNPNSSTTITAKVTSDDYNFSGWTVTSGDCTVGTPATSSPFYTPLTVGTENCTVNANFTYKHKSCTFRVVSEIGTGTTVPNLQTGYYYKETPYTISVVNNNCSDVAHVSATIVLNSYSSSGSNSSTFTLSTLGSEYNIETSQTYRDMNFNQLISPYTYYEIASITISMSGYGSKTYTNNGDAPNETFTLSNGDTIDVDFGGGGVLVGRTFKADSDD